MVSSLAPRFGPGSRRFRRRAVLLACCLVVAACGSTSEDTVEQTTGPTTDPTTDSSQPEVSHSVEDAEPTSTTTTLPSSSAPTSHPGSAMVVEEADLGSLGLTGFELLYSDPFALDSNAPAFEPGPCKLPDPGLADGINTEWAGASTGDPRLVQTVLVGDDLEAWVSAVRDLAECDDLPLKLDDGGVAGAWESVVLAAEGTDVDGVSFAMSMAIADGVGVRIVVFADTADDPLLDPRTIATLTAITLARREF